MEPLGSGLWVVVTSLVRVAVGSLWIVVVVSKRSRFGMHQTQLAALTGGKRRTVGHQLALWILNLSISRCLSQKSNQMSRSNTSRRRWIGLIVLAPCFFRLAMAFFSFLGSLIRYSAPLYGEKVAVNQCCGFLLNKPRLQLAWLEMLHLCQSPRVLLLFLKGTDCSSVLQSDKSSVEQGTSWCLITMTLLFGVCWVCTTMTLLCPVVGSVPGMAELQARWAAKVFSNHVPFKSREARLEETDKDAAFWTNYFKDSSQRLETLVEAYMYVDDIAKQAGVYPDLFGLFKRNPQHWFTATFSPYNGALYRINEPKNEKKAIANLKKHGANTINPIHLLLLVLLRLIWFDFWLKHLEILKFRIQSASWWPTVRRLPPVRAANWVWCIPKRLLFDTTTTIHNDPTATRTKEVTTTHNPLPNGSIKQQWFSKHCHYCIL